MSTPIPPEFEPYVQEAIASGRYQSAEEVVREAFRLLRDRESLRADVKAGFDEIERGEGIELDEKGLRDLFDDVKARGRDRRKAAKSQ